MERRARMRPRLALGSLLLPAGWEPCLALWDCPRPWWLPTLGFACANGS